jgi:quinol monooxygenase YgiN
VTVGLLVPLKAKPGKRGERGTLSRGGVAARRRGTGHDRWFAIGLGTSEFAIFDAFPHDSGRQAHLTGRVAEALIAQAPELFAEPPEITSANVIAAKLPR